MKETQMLDILERIKCLIDYSSLDNVKDYVRVEIENLKGITQKKCRDTKYYFYPAYCKYCENHNCSSNKNV